MKVGRNKKQIEVNFLRRVTKLNPDETLVGFSSPNIPDIWKIEENQIVQQFSKPTLERRSRYFFADNIITRACKEPLQ